MKRLARFHIFIIVLILLMLCGCRSSGTLSYHISEDVDFSYIKKVAVMPFENLTNEKFAGEVIRQLVISELLASGLVDVSLPGEVMSALKGIGVRKIEAPDRKQIQDIGRALNVQGVIMGNVQQYGHTKFGNVSAPEVTITLMMADAGTGDIIWSVTRTKGGASFMVRHFGAKSKTMSETALAVVQDAIDTLPGY